jgi:hypothetical protein
MWTMLRMWRRQMRWRKGNRRMRGKRRRRGKKVKSMKDEERWEVVDLTLGILQREGRRMGTLGKAVE